MKKGHVSGAWVNGAYAYTDLVLDVDAEGYHSWELMMHISKEISAALSQHIFSTVGLLYFENGSLSNSLSSDHVMCKGLNDHILLMAFYHYLVII